MRNSIFKVVNNFKSGIGQLNKGMVQEVKIVKVSLEKRNVGTEYRLLINHDALVSKDEFGNDTLNMFII